MPQLGLAFFTSDFAALLGPVVWPEDRSGVAFFTDDTGLACPGPARPPAVRVGASSIARDINRWMAGD